MDENNVDTGVDTGAQEAEANHIDIGLDQFKHENGKIFGKFDDAVAFGNAYRELEKMNTKNSQDLSALRKANTAPDKYEVKLGEDIADQFVFDENSAEYQAFMPIFKEMGLSNDKVNKLVDVYARSMIEKDASESIDYDAEMKKVGGERGEIMTSINGFVAKNPSLKEFVQNKVQTAEDAIAMANLIKASRGNMDIPETSLRNTLTPVASKQDYLNMAFEYQEKHKNTIAYTPAEQQEYNRLLSLGS